jgi:hypothetical protein
MADIFDPLPDIRNEGFTAIPSKGSAPIWENPEKKELLLDSYMWHPSYGITTSVTDLIGKLPASVNSMFNFIDNPNKSINTTPHITVFEFEPQPYIHALKGLYDTMYNMWASLLNKNNREDFFKNLQKQFSLDSLQTALNKSNIGSLTTIGGLVMDIPSFFYTGMVMGKFIRKAELPYYGDYYMHAKGYDGWSTTTIQSALGGMSDILKKFGLGGLNIPLYPQFQLEGLGPECDEITVEVNLYNDTFKNFVDNIIFINAFVPGAFWIQSGLLQRGSNFFQVEIPGRCVYYLCKADFEVTCVGKSRALNPTVNTDAETTGDFTRLPPIVKDPFRQYMVEDLRGRPPLIPDIYKLKCKFMSILPNNFNTYLYSVRNYSQYRANVGKETTFALQEFLTNFVATVGTPGK